jgi:hypothetical protein
MCISNTHMFFQNKMLYMFYNPKHFMYMNEKVYSRPEYK